VVSPHSLEGILDVVGVDAAAAVLQEDGPEAQLLRMAGSGTLKINI